MIELVPGERVVGAARPSPRRTAPATFPGNPIMPGVKMVEALAQCGAVAVLSQPENRGKLVLFAGIDDVRFKRIVRPGDVLDLVCEVEAVRGPVGKGKVRATVDGELAVRGTLTFAVAAAMIGRATGRPVSITGPRLPRARADRHERRAVASSSTRSDEWIREPHRASASAASPPRARRCPTSRCPLPASAREGRGRAARHRPGDRRDRSRPDMAFPATAAIVADELGMPDAAAYDLSAGCTGFMYAIAQAYAHARRGPRAARARGRRRRARRRSSTGATARRSSSSATAPARSCSSRSTRAASSASSSAPTAAAAEAAAARAAARALFDDRRAAVPADERPRGVQVRDARDGQLGGGDPRRRAGRRSTTSTSTFPTRRTSGSSITRSQKLGFPEEKVVVNVDRYGNTSSGSIPLALADAAERRTACNRASWC